MWDLYILNFHLLEVFIYSRLIHQEIDIMHIFNLK